MQFGVLVLVIATLFIFIIIYAMLRRYKRCPSDRILVIYGKVGKGIDAQGRSSKCIHGGASFIWPVIQDYQFLDLTPMSIDIDLTSALSKQNIRVDVPSRFTVGISTEPGVMTNAAERLLGLDHSSVYDLAKDIIFGQLRLVVATMDIEEINSNRDKFLANVASNVEAELQKIGLKLINVNVTDIKDESGYIEALGKEAAAKAINDARKSVAEKNRDGLVGEANAVQEQRVKVSEANAIAKIGEANAMQRERVEVSAANAKAKIGEAQALQNERIQTAEAFAQAKIGEAEANREERVKTSGADAKAIDGENVAKIDIADSDSSRRERQAEAEKRAAASEKVQAAQALKEAYTAEKIAEEERATRDKASQYADIVVPAEIDKAKVEIDAEAKAENIRRVAKGDADGVLFRKEAEAKGIYEVLTKQAMGLDKIVEAAGENAQDAALLLITDKLTEIVQLQAEAIKNIKIDKVTVWDSGSNGGNGSNGNGQTSTANFLSGLYKSVPALEDVFNMAGMELPTYLKGKAIEEGAGKAPTPTKGNGGVNKAIPANTGGIPPKKAAPGQGGGNQPASPKTDGNPSQQNRPAQGGGNNPVPPKTGGNPPQENPSV